MTNDEVIETLSDLRAKYNCFDDAERKQYHALSMAIKSLTTEAIPVEWIEKYIDENPLYQADDFHWYIQDMIHDWMEKRKEE